MIIKKIKLSNFRNFKNCEIDFSCDKEKKFTIILGNNTYGKTTLIKSFVWCLYRLNLFSDKVLLNSDISEFMRVNNLENTIVELELEHNDIQYRITTKETYKKNENGSIVVVDKAFTKIIKINDNGQSWTISSSQKVEEEIDSILNKNLREYFFFDGETNSIDTIGETKNLNQAVTNILGLARLKALMEYYDSERKDSVPSRLREEIDLTDDASLDELIEQRTEFQEEKQKLNEEKESLETDVERLERQKNDLEEILDANKEVEKDQQRKRQLENDISEKKVKIEKNFLDLIRTINGNTDELLKSLFAASFVKNNFETLMSASSFQKGESYIGIDERGVDDLIRRKQCICGAIIEQGNSAYKHLIQAKEHMEPHDFGKYISDFVENESYNFGLSTERCEDVNDRIEKIVDLIEQIETDEKELKAVKSRIEGKEDVGQLQEEINRINWQIASKKGTIKRIEEKDIPNVANKIEAIIRKIDQSGIANENNAWIYECIDYAENIFELASKKIQKSKKEIRESLEVEVNKAFKMMYHGERKVIIEDDFHVRTSVESDIAEKKIDGSTGMRTVLNYAFVSGLITLAKQSVLQKDDNDIIDPELSSAVYPLIMDAPFSSTDETHICNICGALPNFCDQIIMFIMQKDYQYAENILSPLIGKKYHIEKINETEAKIVEEE